MSIDVDRMVDLYRGGLTQREVAAQLGLRQETVSVHLRAAGVETRGPGPRSQVTDDQIVGLLTEGRTVPEVAASVGMSVSGVYTRMRRHSPSRQLYQRLPRPPGARTINRSKAVAARREAAEERFPPAMRQQLLDELAAGVLLRDALKVVPVSSTTLWERTRWDPVWAEQLNSVLDELRPVGWSHGRPVTYRRGCRCTDCRAAAVYDRFSGG